MSPGVLILSGFFWLGIFMLVGRIINNVRGKHTVNGALLFSWVVGAITAALVLLAVFKPAAQEPVIEWVAGMLIPYFVALIFARRYLKRTSALPPIARDA